MTLKNDIFPSSAAFDLISDFLESSDAERKEAIRKAQAVFGFTLKNKAGEEDNWFIDLKDTGRVFKETPKKTDVTLSLTDDDFGKLVSGNANAQKLFMAGKLKVKGNIMKATAVEPIFKQVQSKAKL